MISYGIAFSRPQRLAALTLFVASLFLSVERSNPGGAGSPEEALVRFLSAMQNDAFEEAYDLASRGMKQGRSKEAWSSEKRQLFQASEAKIFDFALRRAKVEGDVAIVPSVTTSQDKFLNQLGVEEHELYVLVKEGGVWKIDHQEVVERSELPKWFPESSGGASGCGR